MIDYTVKFIMDDKLIDTIADRVLSMLGEENKRIPQLKARLKEIEKGIENLLNAIQMGILTSSTKERLEQPEATKQEVQEKLWKEELKKPTVTREQIVSYIKRFRDIDPTDPKACKTLIDIFINRIYLYYSSRTTIKTTVLTRSLLRTFQMTRVRIWKICLRQNSLKIKRFQGVFFF